MLGLRCSGATLIDVFCVFCEDRCARGLRREGRSAHGISLGCSHSSPLSGSTLSRVIQRCAGAGWISRSGIGRERLARNRGAGRLGRVPCRRERVLPLSRSDWLLRDWRNGGRSPDTPRCCVGLLEVTQRPRLLRHDGAVRRRAARGLLRTVPLEAGIGTANAVIRHGCSVRDRQRPQHARAQDRIALRQDEKQTNETKAWRHCQVVRRAGECGRSTACRNAATAGAAGEWQRSSRRPLGDHVAWIYVIGGFHSFTSHPLQFRPCLFVSRRPVMRQRHGGRSHFGTRLRVQPVP